jgi:RNA polymerase sigma-70 factor (ECF subfamily)
MEPDEAELVRGFTKGDPAVFDRVVRLHGGRMLAVARRILRDEDQARDAVQEAFISAFRARGQFNADSKLSTWLHRIAVNAALGKLRARKRVPEEPLDPLLPSFRGDGHHVEQFAAPDESQDVLVARREVQAAVRAAIDRLPDSYRMVILLRDIEGLDTEEAARTLGISANAVKIRLHRARMALRALIAPTFQGGAA